MTTTRILAALVGAILSCAALADTKDTIYYGAETDDSILSGLCLYAADGLTLYTSATSEDAGLRIVISYTDATAPKVYDADTEIEAITTRRVWAAPSANNIRFEVDTDNCYEIQPAANSWEAGLGATLCIEDTSAAAFLARCWDVPYNLTDAELESIVASGMTLADVATNTYLDTRTVATATYATASALSSLDTDVSALQGDITTVVNEIGDNGSGLTAITQALPHGGVTSACESGTVATCVDSARTEADTDYWAHGTRITFYSGTITGQSGCVRAFDPATDTISFAPRTTQAVSTHSYALVPDSTCAQQ